MTLLRNVRFDTPDMIVVHESRELSENQYYFTEKYKLLLRFYKGCPSIFTVSFPIAHHTIVRQIILGGIKSPELGHDFDI